MIRKFEPADMNQLIRLVKQKCEELGEGIATFDEKQLIEFIRQVNIKKGYQIFVSERGNQIKGYVVCSAYKNPWNGMREGMIHFLYVDPEYRQGFMAKDLFAQAEQHFRNCDCQFFNATTRAFDEKYQTKKEFIEQADSFYQRVMTDCGSNYIKEIV